MTDILSAIAAENGIIESNDTTANTDASNNDATAQAATDAASEDKTTFSDLNIAKPILTALDRIGYTNPTPIQEQAIPFALAGRDLLLSAQTGSGKTAAFVIPVLDRLSRATSFDKLTKALILTPTRELAQQVHDSVRTYSKDMRGLFCVPLVGGAPYNGQITALRKGVQVIVATPGRLLDHIKAGRVDLSNLEVLVLDEADRMLDMGFADDISDILSAAPIDRQTIMCSATWDGPVGKIAASFTKNPERVSIKVESAHIEEKVYYCDDFDHKNRLLDKIVCQQEMDQIIIFAATKRSTEKLAKQLQEAGHKASFLHGDLPQSKRNRIVQDLRNGKVKILVATDVAARG
ncbi:DEAD/DEAH box helicase, partial [Psychrobacter sp. UBA2514]